MQAMRSQSGEECIVAGSSLSVRGFVLVSWREGSSSRGVERNQGPRLGASLDRSNSNGKRTIPLTPAAQCTHYPISLTRTIFLLLSLSPLSLSLSLSPTHSTISNSPPLPTPSKTRPKPAAAATLERVRVLREPP